jgi:transcriptional regulator with XRE-family HTH domain
MNLPTLDVLHNKTGYSVSQLSRILSGRYSPSWKGARKLAAALEISLDNLALLLDSRNPGTDHPINKDIETNPKLMQFRLETTPGKTDKMRLWPMVQE